MNRDITTALVEKAFLAPLPSQEMVGEFASQIIIRTVIEAVLPDITEPLEAEIKALVTQVGDLGQEVVKGDKIQVELEAEIDRLKAERERYLQELNEVNVMRQENEVRAILVEDRISLLEDRVFSLRYASHR